MLCSQANYFCPLIVRKREIQLYCMLQNSQYFFKPTLNEKHTNKSKMKNPENILDIHWAITPHVTRFSLVVFRAYKLMVLSWSELQSRLKSLAL